MYNHLLRICHTTIQHGGPLMILGSVGCFVHCVGTCALCVSGGSVLGRAFAVTCQMAIRHVWPALISFSSVLLFSSVGDLV